MSVDRMGRIGQVLGELQADVAVLVTALQMIEQGYVFKGSERHDLDMDMARLIARDALGAVEK